MHDGGVPENLSRLPELASNMFFAWHPPAQELFSKLDRGLWESTEHNPVRLLAETENLRSAAEDAGIVALCHQALEDLDRYLESRDTWMERVYGGTLGGPVAYFSAEFGLHESLPVYSGGLGVLAGDHIKSASDLGLDLVGVGILYGEGYFRQRINAEGMQEEFYEPLGLDTRPVAPEVGPDGAEVRVGVEIAGREVSLAVWKVAVGRTAVYLLDADVPENSDKDRGLTARLYGGDNRTRISQEIILGIGGVRALRALGLSPTVFHMNEGHAAFSGIERIREMVVAGKTFEEARNEVTETSVFTTHTPVPAGHDHFDPDLFWEHAANWPEALGTDRDALWALGHKDGSFNMTVLAFDLSRGHNAVSVIHRDVSLDMWGDLLDVEKANGASPIIAVTNGVHTWSWLSPEMSGLFDRHAKGRAWRREPENPAAWSFVEEIPARELWESHIAGKRRMSSFVDGRLRSQSKRTGATAPPDLDPDALTIGFSRRFATYKRATLLLSDPERLKRIISRAGRPVQFLFAGKAHPADQPAKEFIRALHEASLSEGLAGHLFILEDYDINVTRNLVAGVDVWLNNPRRPLEASGTSGQKASINGAPNFSVLDGWWPEAYNGRNGWAIGEAGGYESEEEGDREDAESLYQLLENSVVPLFYERDAEGVPRAWVEVMKEAISTVAPYFSTQRMVQDYVHKLYAPRAPAARVHA
jgi:starch phosphorylase